MDRRAFLGGLALGPLGVPRAARGQPAPKVYRIGMLGATRRLWDGIDEPLPEGNRPLISASALAFLAPGEVGHGPW